MSDAGNTSTVRPAGLYARHRIAIIVLVHAVLLAAALFTAFCLAYNFRFHVHYEEVAHNWVTLLFLPFLALALPIKLLVLHREDQFRGAWRYVGLRDLFGVIRASLVGSFLFLLAYFVLENVWQQVFGKPLIDRGPVAILKQSSVFALDWACTIAFISAARVLVRFYYEEVQPDMGVPTRRVLIVGAGDTGEAVLRELLRTGRDRYRCVGFLDDDAPLSTRIHGVPVLGPTEQLREVCQQHEIDEVLIAHPGATPRTIRELVERAEGTGVLFKTIPAVTDVIAGRVRVSQIRDVEIADLLGREPVQLDAEGIGAQLRGQRVLVTGAGGSIGAEICRQIAAFNPRRLLLLERGENCLFEIHRELTAQFPGLDIVPVVADVTDRARIASILKKERPMVVFHAAAHKHVPMMECNVGEAIKNNIGGSMVVANACRAADVPTMVMVSTDKAVNPTSIMGCSKRVAEMYVQSLSRADSTNFITVRFGNVLGSSGSVVPLFREQIARGGPVTVTHPDMVRFFMTIPEAAQLVLQAGTMGRGGEIYVLHMGDPVRIVDLARDMITLSGLRPGIDIEITYSGVRPGEKLYEELSFEGEDIGDTAHPKIGIWKHRPEDHTTIAAAVEELLAQAHADVDDERLRSALTALVPEFCGGKAGASPSQPSSKGSQRVTS